MALLQCENLTLGYGGSAIVQGLNFAVQPGDYLCVLGENGAGKTTLVKTLLGLQPPLGGTVRLGDGLRQNEIGYMPQQTPVQRDFPASVCEIVLSGCQARAGLRPFYSRADKARAAANLARLGIAELRGRCYRELSGGQQQRVLLARALTAAERLLLLDEPVAGLDPLATAELYQLIARLHREDGLAVLMVSHDVRAALQYASHILHIGGDIFFGRTADYLASAPGQKLLAAEGGAAV